MRKFTKEHNELQWLFPICETKESASKMFDEVESEAEYYFENCYDEDHETFEKDDMIDSYMKGYSVATRVYSSQIHQAQYEAKSEKQMNDNVWEMLKTLSDKYTAAENRIKELEEELNKYKTK